MVMAFGRLAGLLKRFILASVSEPHYSTPVSSISSSQRGVLAQWAPFPEHTLSLWGKAASASVTWHLLGVKADPCCF